MSDPRVIKKYPNRRLYDTVESRYITLADIRRLVIERIDFVVIDKKTQSDITRSILLQVIAEQENHSPPLMTREFLSQVIRNYGEGCAGRAGSYLEQSLRLFSAQQRDLRDRIRQRDGFGRAGIRRGDGRTQLPALAVGAGRDFPDAAQRNDVRQGPRRRPASPTGRISPDPEGRCRDQAPTSRIDRRTRP